MIISNYILRYFSRNDKKRITKNFTSNLVNNFINILTQFFFPVLMITIYGIENFGLWIFLLAIPDIFYLLNLDFNSAARTELSILYNQKKYFKIKLYFNNFAFLNYLIFFVSLPLILIASSYIDLNLDIFSTTEKDNLRLIFYIIFFCFFLKFLIGIFDCGISYKGKNYICENINTSFEIFSKILILIFGLISNNLLFAAYAYLTANILRLILFYFYFKKLSKELKLFKIKNLNFNKIIQLFRLSIPYYLKSLSSLLKHSYQILIIGVFFGPYIVGFISTIKTLFYFFPIRVWSIFQRTFMYEFAKLFAAKNYLNLKNNFNIFIKICFIFLGFYLLTTFLFGEIIYSFWLNKKFNFNNYIILLLSLDLSFYILSNSFNHIHKSINNFLDFSKLEFLLNFILIFLILIMFRKDSNYVYIFYFNLLISITLSIYAVYKFKKDFFR